MDRTVRDRGSERWEVAAGAVWNAYSDTYSYVPADAYCYGDGHLYAYCYGDAYCYGSASSHADAQTASDAPSAPISSSCSWLDSGTPEQKLASSCL